MDRFVYFDFEYRDNRTAGDILMMAFMPSGTTGPQVIDLRESSARPQIKTLVDRYQAHIWVAYNVMADLACLDTLGVDITSLRVVDAMAEARMVTLTHPEHGSPRSSLPWTLNALGIAITTDSFEKDECRDLILGTTAYTDDEWRRIERYCVSDVLPLPHILEQCWTIHESATSLINLGEALGRGEYLKKRLLLDIRNSGFPVDASRCKDVSANRSEIIRALQQAVNDTYGEIYVAGGNGELRWSHQAFRNFIVREGIPWETTPTGQLKTDKDYLKEKSQQHPRLELLYEVRKTLRAFATVDVHELVHDHHVKPPIVPFSQKTSRESPKPSKGFMLGLPPWQRSLIKPRPGDVMIAADWSQQEVAIAAALSGDQEYLDLYNDPSGDVYLALAKRAGAITPEMDQIEVDRIRTTFKIIQLGLGYGKGVQSLAEDVYHVNHDENGHSLLSEEDAADQARLIFWWHKDTFATYWQWIDDSIRRAREFGYIKSLDGWTYFVDERVRNTQLLNFPMQSNGAYMMRRAVEHCYDSGRVDLVCTLHDALYITCHEEDAEEQQQLLIRCMDAACHDVLGDTLTIRTDVNVYDSETGYSDPRSQIVLDKIDALLAKT